ncbi:hypothetical protein KIN20_034838 [Parelaphostrongylus tenuis]|uniref:Uncharacterized protein n=1 Tax=Parelaphostrongylus tenuis TaxID=148309 RepID=A0AAD5WJZ6_PARTN|nr:hypothetical protein KIN20_034838 [Parelaphostrongylus tenuis]
MDFYGQHSMFPPRSGFFFGMQENRRPYNGDKSTEKRGDEHRGELLNRAQTSAHRDENVERCSSHMKQDIPAKKSRRIKRRGKGSSKSTSDEKTGTLEKTDKKIKKKKSPIQTPSSSAKCDTEHKGSVVQVMKRIRGVPLGASMKDKTKKWELVAVKGKASYLRNRSQRMLKDRMNKYRLVDSKGVVVEGTSEEEPCTSSNMPRSLSSGTNETSLSHQSSYKSGTASETVSKTQRKQYDGKISVSSTPSAVAPSTSSTSFARSSVLSSVSTPRGSDNAVLAYGDSRGLSTTNVESIRDIQLKKASDDSSSALDGRDKRSVHISSESPPVNPSVAVESRSVTSRADSTSLGNVTNPPCLLTVKEEPTESPPPVVLPSPPHIDRTVSCPTTAAEGNIAGEKEREEFWMLGIAEMKKGQEIHAARLKIENLQKALIEATSDLGRIEVEMNEILRRKSELLGISVPDNFA